MEKVKTLVEIRIAEEIEGVPHGVIKIVRGNVADGVIADYALFINNEYLGSLEEEVINDQQAILVGLGKIRSLLALLSE